MKDFICVICFDKTRNFPFTSEAVYFCFREFNAEPELMPKTPSQKKNSRRKRVSLGHQEENQARRRFVALMAVLGKFKFHIQIVTSSSCPDFQRESVATSGAPLSNHCTSSPKKRPFPPLKQTPPPSPSAPPAKTNKPLRLCQRM